MLPSKGFFSNVICPHNGVCERPFCHYRHSKIDIVSDQDSSEESIAQIVKETVNRVLSSKQLIPGTLNVDRDKIITEAIREVEASQVNPGLPEMPSYNPTPISQLNKRHIPVTFLPDKPTYSKNYKFHKTTPQRSLSFGVQNQKIEPILSNEVMADIKTKTSDKPSICLNNSEPFSNPGSNPQNSFSPTKFLTVIEDINKHKDSLSCTNSPHVLGETNNPFITKLSSEEEKSTIRDIENDISSFRQSEEGNRKVENGLVEEQSFLQENHKEIIGDKKECTQAKEIKSENASRENSPNHREREKRKLHSSAKRFKKIKLDDTEILSDSRKEMSEIQMNKHVWESSKKEYKINDFPIDDDFPPLKKIRGIIAGSPALLPTPTGQFRGKWERVNKIISTKSSTSPQVLINPVPDVNAYLAGSSQISKSNLINECYLTNSQTHGNRSSSLPPKEKEHFEEKQVIKTIVRKAHIPRSSGLQYPAVIFYSNSRIPHSVRQECLNKMFQEACKYCDPDIAREKSQKMELEICRRIYSVKPYKSTITMALFRIRKQKGFLNDYDKPSISLQSDSVPPYTNGWTLYKCFTQYLLSDIEYKSHGFPMPHEGKVGCAYIEQSARRNKLKRPTEKYQRLCDHCCQTYFVNKDGFPLKEFDCSYHWGKIRRQRLCGSTVEKYSCCDGDIDTDPCTTGRYHVSNLFDEDLLEGFVSTRPQSPWRDTDKAGIFGLDCEMCYTTKGIELTRCTLVDLNGNTVYDKVVLPDAPIIDYCTRFSGITEDIMKTCNHKLSDIQNDLLRMVNDKTILVGHSLENDLKVLRLFHRTLVDTSIVFPHSRGLPFKNSLKRIAKDLINLTIQESENGHDSYEDANACVQLMLWKIKEDSKQRKPRIIISLEPRESRRGE